MEKLNFILSLDGKKNFMGLFDLFELGKAKRIATSLSESCFVNIVDDSEKLVMDNAKFLTNDDRLKIIFMTLETAILLKHCSVCIALQKRLGSIKGYVLEELFRICYGAIYWYIYSEKNNKYFLNMYFEDYKNAFFERTFIFDYSIKYQEQFKAHILETTGLRIKDDKYNIATLPQMLKYFCEDDLIQYAKTKSIFKNSVIELDMSSEQASVISAAMLKAQFQPFTEALTSLAEEYADSLISIITNKGIKK